MNVQIEELSTSTQQNTDDHLSHVSSITSQNKDLRRKLAEKEQELSQVLIFKFAYFWRNRIP